MKKIFPIVLILVALAAGGHALWQAVPGMGADLKALKATDEKAQATIAEKQAIIDAKTAENAALAAKDAAAEVVKAQLRSALSTAQAEANKLREELKTAPPEAVLAKTQDWLGTREIWLRANAASEVEAVFSLAAFRLNADALADRVFMKFTLVPNLEGQLKASEGQNADKAAIIINQATIIGHKDEIIGEKDKQLGARTDTIKALKRRNLWRIWHISWGPRPRLYRTLGEPMNIFGIIVDPLVVAAIMAIFTGGIVSLIAQLIKNALHLEGAGAVILTGLLSAACTAVYFLIIAPPLILGTFVVYTIVVFGEATGYYHFKLTKFSQGEKIPVVGIVIVGVLALISAIAMFVLGG